MLTTRRYIQCVPSVQQKSSGLKFCKSRTGSHVMYSCHHNSSRFTFPIFMHSWLFSVFHSLQSLTPRIYEYLPKTPIHLLSLKKRKKNYELFSKAKIELHLFQQYFTPHTPPLKHVENETTLGPDLPSTRIIRSTIPFRKCFKSCTPMSDLVTRYGPQTTTRFACLVPFEREPSKSEFR